MVKHIRKVAILVFFYYFIHFFLYKPLFAQTNTVLNYANGSGTGALQKKVFWLSWGNNGPSLRPSDSDSSKITEGVYEWQFTPNVKVVANVSNIVSILRGCKLASYTPGSYFGDGLNHLYPSDNSNNGIVGSGIITSVDSASVRFDINISLQFLKNATWQSISYPGLVFGDAESMARSEYIRATSNSDSSWQLLDEYDNFPINSSDYILTVSNFGKDVKFSLKATAQNDDIRVQATAISIGATQLTDVEMQGRGNAAVGLGLVMPFDFGDAPLSYGNAGNYMANFSFVGPLPPTDSVYSVINIVNQKSTYKTVANVYMGINNVDADGNPPNSPLANFDDLTENNDENGFKLISQPNIKVNDSSNIVVSVNVTNNSPNPASLYGWMDFNGDSLFSSNEATTVTIPANTINTNVSLSFPYAQYGSIIRKGFNYARFRLTTDTLNLKQTLRTADPVSIIAEINGETEDYKLNDITGITVRGNVFDDANGLTDSLCNGAGIGKADTTQLYAYIIDSTNTIIRKVAVQNGGGFIFSGNDALQNGNFIVAVEDNNFGTIGSVAPKADSLPFGWQPSSWSYGANNLAGTGIPKGTLVSRLPLTTPLGGLDVTDLDIGLDKLPIAPNDTVSTQQGSPVSLFVIRNVSDPDGSVVKNSFLMIDPADSTPKTKVTIAGVGTYQFDTLSGTVIFTPILTFSGTTPPLGYIVKDNALINSLPGYLTVLVKPLPKTDLSVLKQLVTPLPLQKGETVLFRVVLVNNGPDTATGVLVKDTLLANLGDPTLTNLTVGNYTYIVNGRIIQWNISKLAPNRSDTLLFKSTILSNKNIYNAAAVTGNEIDTFPSNNYSSVGPLAVQSLTDLSINKALLTPTPLHKGQSATFQLIATNNGPDTATGVKILDTLSANLGQPTSITTNIGTDTFINNSKSLSWTIPTLAPKQSDTLLFNANVLGGPTITNTANITGNEKDTIPANNTSSISPATVQLQVDLSINKTSLSPSPLTIGKPVSFLIVVTNLGGDSSTGFKVRDTLAPNLGVATQITTKYGTASYDSASRGITWQGTGMAVNSNDTLIITSTVLSGHSVANSATVLGNEPDPTLSNNYVSIPLLPVRHLADLAVQKSVLTKSPIYKGQNVVFQLVASNNGPDTATNVVVMDTIASNLGSPGSVTTKYGSDTFFISTRAFDWTIPTLPPGQNDTLLLSCKVLSGSSFTNVSTISGNETDTIPSNNKSTTGILPVQSITDLAVVKSLLTQAPLRKGQTVTFQLIATNNGPDTATGVAILDTIANNLGNPSNIITHYGMDTFYNGSRAFSWSIGVLAPRQSDTLLFNSVILGGKNLTNTATITGNQMDTIQTNNISTIASSPFQQQVDLSINKISLSTGSLTIGKPVSFLMVVTNLGGDSSTGFKVRDTLASNLGFPTQMTTQYGSVTFDSVSRSVIWQGFGIPVNGKDSLQITCNVLSGHSVSNAAAVVGNEPDSILSNNYAAIIPLSVSHLADLYVQKTILTKGSLYKGENIVFQMIAGNNGPDTATGLVIGDTIASNLSNPSSIGTKYGTDTFYITTRAFVWTIPSLPPGQKDTLLFGSNILGGSLVTNVSYITGNETDTVLSNNRSAISPLTVQKRADVSINKTAGNPNPAIGDSIPFSIVITNNGPDSATGIIALDTLDPHFGLPYKITPNKGNVSIVSGTSNVLSWNIPILAPSQSALLTFSDSVLGGTKIGNSVVVSANETDTIPKNNKSSIDSISILSSSKKADLSITKLMTNTTTLSIGENVNFSLSVNNLGPNLATGIIVRDTLATYLDMPTNVFADFGSTTYDPATKIFTWQINELDSNKTANLLYSSNVNSSGSLVNAAAVSANETDPNLSNNYSLVGPYVIPVLDLIIPNVITPNGDGKNDYFVINGLTYYPNSELSIFNRWDNLVFHSNDYSNNWSANGLLGGTYYYVLSINKPGGKDVRKGWVLVVK